MRTIEFRGIRKDSKEWVHGFVVRFQNDDSTYSYYIQEDTLHEVDPKTIGQYTGLRDNTRTEEHPEGVKVFDGDLFEMVYSNVPDGYSILGGKKEVKIAIAIVVYKWGQFLLEYNHPETGQLLYASLYEVLKKNDEKVVIGNIHQNPELKP